MKAFDSAWGVVKGEEPIERRTEDKLDKVLAEMRNRPPKEGIELPGMVRSGSEDVDFENIRAGEPCYACHMDNAPEMCKGATHSYHGGAGGLFTYCKSQLSKIMQDPTISGDDLSWIEDIREM